MLLYCVKHTIKNPFLQFNLRLIYQFFGAKLKPIRRGDFGPRPISLGLRENKMYYVYILKSDKNGKLYKGFTNDLKRRVQEHKFGKSVFTKNNGPWRLIYYEAFISKIDARREEEFLRTGKGKERIKYLLTIK